VLRTAVVLPLFDEHRSRDDAGDQRIDAQEKESGVIEVTHATSTFRFDDFPACWEDEITVAVITGDPSHLRKPESARPGSKPLGLRLAR
jgi:hypothetical protein